MDEEVFHAADRQISGDMTTARRCQDTLTVLGMSADSWMDAAVDAWTGFDANTHFPALARTYAVALHRLLRQEDNIRHLQDALKLHQDTLRDINELDNL